VRHGGSGAAISAASSTSHGRDAPGPLTNRGCSPPSARLVAVPHRAEVPAHGAALARLVPLAGAVRVGETDIQALSLQQRAQRVAMLDQTPRLDPELTVTLDYATAKAILVDGNPQAGMQAFMAGKIKVQGDMTKMMAMQQGGPPDPNAQALAEAIKEMTV